MRTGQLNGVKYNYSASQETARDAEEAAFDPNAKTAKRNQIRIALIDLGKLDEVKTFLSGLSNSEDDQKIVEYWTSRDIFHIDDAEVTAVTVGLGYGDPEKITLFNAASQIDQ